MADSIRRPQIPDLDLNRREGLLVQSLDGRMFFISEAEMNRAELQGAAHERASQLFAKAGPPSPEPQFDNCSNLLRFLLSNTPFTDQWLGAAEWFFDECVGGGRVA